MIHKRVALGMLAAALIFFLASGVLALFMRTELADPGIDLVDSETYSQLFSMHGSGMIYLVVVPVAIALGLYFVPLQVGAPEVAAPRVVQLGAWLWLFGGVSMYAGFLTDSGAGAAGWTAFYPLSGAAETPGSGMEMWIVGVALAGGGVVLVAGAVLATIIRHRAPGMTMMRLPVFTWSSLVTALLTVFAFPSLVVGMILLLAARHLGGVFDSSGGPIAYQHLFWFFGHPAVYVMFFPFLGVVGEIIATFSRRRFFGYAALVAGLIAFSALSMSVWAHHMFATGQITNEYFSFTSHALVVPAGIEYFDLIATMIGGAIVLRVPMLFALGFVCQFLIGGLTGVMVASPPIDYHAHDSFFVVGHFHYTLFAGSLFGAFAALYYWFPKVTGRMMSERLGRLNFVVLAVGANLTFFPMLLLGQQGMPRRIVDYTPADGWTTENLLASIGAFLIAAGVAGIVLDLVRSLRSGRVAGDDPWEGHTLEWATSSPPPRWNFDALPEIRSYAPLLDLREGDDQHPAAAPPAAEAAR